MAKLGVLILGAGNVSTQHIAAFQKNPFTEVRAIASRRRESCLSRAAEAGLEAIGIYTDLAQALKHPGIDIVAVCTPQHLHAEHTIAAACAGKHILIEKPACTRRQDLDRMLEAVGGAEVKTLVSFVLRWNPLVVTLKSLIDGGAIGSVFSIEVDYLHAIGSFWGGYEDGRTIALGVSPFLIGGCHAVDMIRFLAGKGVEGTARIAEVAGMAGGWRRGADREFDYRTFSETKVSPLEYDGCQLALFRLEGGIIAKAAANFDCVMPYRFPIAVYGSRGTIRDNRIWSPKFPGQTDWVEIPTILPDSGAVTHHPFQAEIDHFVSCILSGRESHASLADAVNTHEAIFALEEAQRTGKAVAIE